MKLLRNVHKMAFITLNATGDRCHELSIFIKICIQIMDVWSISIYHAVFVTSTACAINFVTRVLVMIGG